MGINIADILRQKKNTKSWDGKELGLFEEQEGDQWSQSCVGVRGGHCKLKLESKKWQLGYKQKMMMA